MAFESQVIISDSSHCAWKRFSVTHWHMWGNRVTTFHLGCIWPLEAQISLYQHHIWSLSFLQLGCPGLENLEGNDKPLTSLCRGNLDKQIAKILTNNFKILKFYYKNEKT